MHPFENIFFRPRAELAGVGLVVCAFLFFF
jgi:hypothetical protein